MKTIQRGFIVPLLLIIVAILLAGGGAYFYTQNKLENPAPTGDVALPQATTTTQTSNTQTKVVSQLALDLANVTPQFIDENGIGGLQDGTPLPEYISKIKKEIAINFPPSEKGYRLYSDASNIILSAIGKRYVIFNDRFAKEIGSDQIFDSVTLKSTVVTNPFSIQIFKTNKFAVYVSPRDICTYTLDHPTCIPLPGARLPENHTYFDHMGGPAVLKETHTDTSLTVSVYDANDGTKILREATFVLP